MRVTCSFNRVRFRAAVFQCGQVDSPTCYNQEQGFRAMWSAMTWSGLVGGEGFRLGSRVTLKPAPPHDCSPYIVLSAINLT